MAGTRADSSTTTADRPGEGSSKYEAIAYRSDIDGLRAVAVLSVLMCHLHVPFFTGGFVGVDVFFVISGYLITALIFRNLQGKGFSFGEFYSRRIRRLLPAMFFTLALTTIASFFILAPTDFATFCRTAIYTVTSVNNFYSWLTSGYWDTASELKPLLHMWSLAVEEQYYLIWPALMMAFFAMSRGSKWLLGISIAICVLSTAAAELFLSTQSSAVYYLLPFRAAELAIGAAVVFLPKLPALPKFADSAASLLGLLLIAVAVFFFGEKTRFPGVMALVPTIGAALIIYFGATDNLVSRALSVRPVLYIGLISYSLYLVHWPIIALYRYVRLPPGADAYDLTGWDQAALAVSSIALGAFSYHFIEGPTRSKRLISTGAINTFMALLAILAITGFSHGWALEGFPSRMWKTAPAASASGGASGATAPSGSHANGLPADMSVIMASVKPKKSDDAMDAAIHAMPSPKARIIVIGDSHSPRLHYPLAEWGLKNNYAIELFKLGGGCPGLVDTYVATNNEKEDITECNTQGPQKIRDLGKENFDTIVFVARWGLYTSNLTSLDSRIRGKTTRRSRSLSQKADAGFVDDMPSSQQAFEKGVRDSVAYFKSKGKRVIFVTQPPPVGSGVVRCVTTQPTPSAVEQNCFPMTYEEQLTEIKWSTDKLIALGKELDFDVVNAHDAFCVNSVCTAMNAQGVFYSDGDHLSYPGASVLAAQVEKVIEQHN